MAEVDLTQAEKNKVRELFFRRVPNAQRRTKIYRVARSLSDNDNEFWQLVYHYSLQENWADLEKDFKKYGSIDFLNEDFGAEKPKKKKKS